jgi:hypothetical protein
MVERVPCAWDVAMGLRMAALGPVALAAEPLRLLCTHPEATTRKAVGAALVGIDWATMVESELQGVLARPAAGRAAVEAVRGMLGRILGERAGELDVLGDEGAALRAGLEQKLAWAEGALAVAA